MTTVPRQTHARESPVNGFRWQFWRIKHVPGLYFLLTDSMAVHRWRNTVGNIKGPATKPSIAKDACNTALYMYI